MVDDIKVSGEFMTIKFPIKAEGKILATLHQIHSSLPSAMRRLVKYIMNHPQDVVTANIADIARNASVGEATVVRLSRNLGFPGFQEFKIDLAIELADNKKQDDNIIDSHVLDEDPPDVLGKKIARSISDAVNENIEFFDPQMAIKVTRAIYNAGRVFIMGMGNSGLCAAYLKNKLTRIGINAIFELSTHFMYTQASLLKPGDVAIAISQKGVGMETRKAFQIAKDAGALCVAITHHQGSPLARDADFVFYSGNREGFLQSDSLGTMSAQLHICEIIYIMVIQLNMAKAVKTKQVTLKALEYEVKN